MPDNIRRVRNRICAAAGVAIVGVLVSSATGAAAIAPPVAFVFSIIAGFSAFLSGSFVALAFTFIALFCVGSGYYGSGSFVAFAFAVIASVIAVYVAFRSGQHAPEMSMMNMGRPSRVVTGASRLLPADARDEHREEWAAWMLDLRTIGTSPIRLWDELFTILIAALRLAITLRLAARRAVDR